MLFTGTFPDIFQAIIYYCAEHLETKTQTNKQTKKEQQQKTKTNRKKEISRTLRSLS